MTPEEIKERLADKTTWADGWQTQGGQLLRILCADRARTDYRILALVMDVNGEETCRTYREDGICGSGSCNDALVPRPVKRKGWVNVWARSFCERTNVPRSFIYQSRADADEGAGGLSDRIACIEIEFHEGQGLNDPN